ncbi:MAG: hypothetical protein VX278_23045 [Myxococcota bacterium]|nr:hypothetical protein [Myxococcota bacterium]
MRCLKCNEINSNVKARFCFSCGTPLQQSRRQSPGKFPGQSYSNYRPPPPKDPTFYRHIPKEKQEIPKIEPQTQIEEISIPPLNFGPAPKTEIQSIVRPVRPMRSKAEPPLQSNPNSIGKAQLELQPPPPNVVPKPEESINENDFELQMDDETEEEEIAPRVEEEQKNVSPVEDQDESDETYLLIVAGFAVFCAAALFLIDVIVIAMVYT